MAGGQSQSRRTTAMRARDTRVLDGQPVPADLLSFSALGASEGAAPEQIDLNTILQAATLNLKTAIEESSAVVTSSPLPEIAGQRADLVQLFQNLVGNAIKYRGQGLPVVHIHAENRNTEWLFLVADNGIGIDAKYYQRIFGVFKRLHGKEIPGTSIRLAICQRVVERYGGRIWVESQVGSGATFYFTLPTTAVSR